MYSIEQLDHLTYQQLPKHAVQTNENMAGGEGGEGAVLVTCSVSCSC